LFEAPPLDTLATPPVRGEKRVAGVALPKPRRRTVAAAVVALAATPEGFTSAQLAEPVRAQPGRPPAGYQPRQAADDLRQLRGKALGERIGGTRR
jgi:hypothetical protein